MARQLGFRCECGHTVFASTDYFGEQVKCDGCGRVLQIPLGFYNKVPLHLYRWALLALVIFLSVIYLKYGHFLGRSAGWTAWLLPVWIGVIGYIFCYHIPKGVMFVAYSSVTKKEALDNRGHVAALGGDDIACYAPLAVYLALAGVYIATWEAGGADPISAIRDPWIFLIIGGVLAIFATVVLTWLAWQLASPRLKRF